jgi:hypothetical protein
MIDLSLMGPRSSAAIEPDPSCLLLSMFSLNEIAGCRVGCVTPELSTGPRVWRARSRPLRLLQSTIPFSAHFTAMTRRRRAINE